MWWTLVLTGEWFRSREREFFRGRRGKQQRGWLSGESGRRELRWAVRLLPWISHFVQYKKRSAVEGLIEIENPNRVLNKNKKATELDLDAAPVLSRRERWVCNRTGCGEEAALRQVALAPHEWISNFTLKGEYLDSQRIYFAPLFSPSGRR